MRNLQKLFIFFYIFSTITALLMSCTPRSDPFMVAVYRTETGTVTTVPFETYVKCVVANEVPGSFHMEALKAQAVTARTYAAAKIQASKESGCPKVHPMAPLCDSTHCQVFQDASILENKSSWEKICEAVDSTESQMLYYNNQLVQHALFHASSGGRTENSEDVFVSAVPYLRSVPSPYESEYTRSGHGVGMSQQGANGMANAGYSYEEILAHFYTGTTVH